MSPPISKRHGCLARWTAFDATCRAYQFAEFRAARLPLLPVDNPHVASDLAKIKTAKQLSPILLVRGDFPAGIPLQIADGYHRVCASYHTDENTDIPVVLAVPD